MASISFITRLDRQSGTAVCSYESNRVRVSVGAFTHVEIDGILFEFESEHLDFSLAELMNPAVGDALIIERTMRAASERASEAVFRQMLLAIRESYLDGVRHGGTAKLEQIREALEL